MASAAKLRIDVAIHDLLTHSNQQPPAPPASTSATLSEPVFPQYPELLTDTGPETFPEKRDWTREQIWRKVRGWLIPYIRSRALPGDFSPLPPICLSSTSATSIAGTAGPSTTRSKA